MVWPGGILKNLRKLVEEPRAVDSVVVVLSAWFLLGAYIVAYAYIRARTLNLMANATIIGPMRLRSTLRVRPLAWIYASNIVAILATVGLAIPWATIRVETFSFGW